MERYDCWHTFWICRFARTPEKNTIPFVGYIPMVLLTAISNWEQQISIPLVAYDPREGTGVTAERHLLVQQHACAKVRPHEVANAWKVWWSVRL